jgi:diguanylate cyclase (GGDEF)-like protein
MRAGRVRARDVWLGIMVAGFVLMAVSLALRWWTGAWIALGVAVVYSVAFWRLHADVERERLRWHHALDAMETAIVLYDRDDRIVFANADFRRQYELSGAQLVPGMNFEQLLRGRVQSGAVPEARGQEEAWIAQRLAQHRERRGGSMLREMGDGRWRRITEQPLANGGLVGYSIDVTDLVEREQELARARAEAEQSHRLLRDAIEAMPAVIEVYDAEDRLTLFNQRMLRLYPHMDAQAARGQTFETLARRALAQGKVPEARGREGAWLAERLALRAAGHAAPSLQQAADGSWIHIYETRIGSGGTVVVRIDVSEVIRQRDAQRAARQLLDDAIEALPDGFALFDADDRLVLCNRRYREIYPESAPAMQPGTTFEDIVRHGLERGQYLQAGDAHAWLAERLRRHRETDGTPVLQQVSGGRWLRIDERRTRSGGIAGVRTDVTELMQARQAAESARAEAQSAAAALRDANAALETLSTTDGLTGLANRRRFDQRLHEELQRVQRYDAPLTVLLIDVDYFKRYNDNHGHLAGDGVLKAVAQMLAQQARRPGELAARYGGEEFVILLPHADAAAGLAVAGRCQAEMQRLALPHGRSPAAPHVTLSIGVAQWHHGKREDAGSLLRRADSALYAAKAAGRARSLLAASPDA